MAAASSPEKGQPLLQLQEVDSSRVGCRVLSPILSSSSPGLSLETSQPICIPSPYTELSHDFTTIPFYSPTIFSYAAPGISECSSMHQSLRPSLFWPSHGHVGSPLPLHHSQTHPQHGQPIQKPWVERSPRDRVLTTRWDNACCFNNSPRKLTSQFFILILIHNWHYSSAYSYGITFVLY